MTKRSKKGVTIAEVVIAMSITAIVMITALSIIEMTRNATSKDNNYNKAVFYAQNALECFKFAESKDGFENLLTQYLTPYLGTPDTPSPVPTGNSSDTTSTTYIYTYTIGTCELTIKVNFSSSPKTFNATAKGSDEDAWFEIKYEK